MLSLELQLTKQELQLMTKQEAIRHGTVHFKNMSKLLIKNQECSELPVNLFAKCFHIKG